MTKPTRDEAVRNLQWRIAGMFLRMLAARSVSIEAVESQLEWPAGKLERFLSGAVVGADTGFSLRDIAAVAWVLEFRIHIGFEQETTE